MTKRKPGPPSGNLSSKATLRVRVAITETGLTTEPDFDSGYIEIGRVMLGRPHKPKRPARRKSA